MIADLLKIGRLAEIAVRIGVNLQPGQHLVIAAPLEAASLVREIAKHAWRAGAGGVSVQYEDQQLARIHLEEGNEETFDHAPLWHYDGLHRAMAEGAAYLRVAGSDPTLLASCDPAKKSRLQKAQAMASQQISRLVGGMEISWSAVPFAHPAWARAVFPDLPPEAAVARLWEMIFAATRVDVADPIANWKAHAARLKTRTDFLTAQKFAALKFRGPGTDLRVGLIDGHLWVGGAAQTTAGINCLPNIPTEEVFTMPHRDRVDGVVRASKPLAHGGALIENIEVRFEAGRIVEANATEGAEIFRNLIATDEGAARLGEVALVPDDSPISRSNLLYYNTLFDENAASHIAIGRPYALNAPGGRIENAIGANDSLIHVDWMIGSAEMDVDGERADGSLQPVMRQGAFV